MCSLHFIFSRTLESWLRVTTCPVRPPIHPTMRRCHLLGWFYVCPSSFLLLVDRRWLGKQSVTYVEWDWGFPLGSGCKRADMLMENQSTLGIALEAEVCLLALTPGGWVRAVPCQASLSPSPLSLHACVWPLNPKTPRSCVEGPLRLSRLHHATPSQMHPHPWEALEWNKIQ